MGRWYTYNQITNSNHSNLGLDARPILEQPLQYLDQEVAHRCRDKCAVDRHLRDAAVEVVAVLAAVLGDPAGEQFLQTG